MTASVWISNSWLQLLREDYEHGRQPCSLNSQENGWNEALVHVWTLALIQVGKGS